MEKKSCFVIMPFTRAKGPSGELDEKTLTYIYEHIISKALVDFKVKNRKVFTEVSRYNSKIGSIISGITVNLNNSDLVIADLTGLNPNVMYELGVRHTLKRGTIVITQDVSTIPSDLRDYMCVEYKYSEQTLDQSINYEKFKTVLYKTISELFETDKYDSPVLSYLKGKEKYWREDELKTLKENIVISKFIFDNCGGLSEVITKIEKEKKDMPLILISSLLNNLSGALNDLQIILEERSLYEALQSAKSILSDVVKKTSISEYFYGIGQMIPDQESKNLFQQKFNINDKHFLDYFSLLKGDYKQLSFKEIFSEKGKFQKSFLGKLDIHLENRAEELDLSMREIKTILKS